MEALIVWEGVDAAAAKCAIVSACAQLGQHQGRLSLSSGDVVAVGGVGVHPMASRSCD
jgi:hypothetical protein